MHMKWLYKLIEWFRRVMYGRYGSDQLSVALLIFYIIVVLFAQFLRMPALLIVGYAILIISFFRMLSKNISARRKENELFLKVYRPVKSFFKTRIIRFKQRKQYRFFRCPTCKTTVRVPKLGKKISITCPHCGNKFTKKA